MGSGRVSIKNFSSKSRITRRLLLEEGEVDSEGAASFDANDQKNTKLDTSDKKRKEVLDLCIPDSTSEDVFDGLVDVLALTPSGESGESSAYQSRQDVDDFLEVKTPTFSNQDLTNDDEYAGVREAALTDDDECAGVREAILTDEEENSSGYHENDSSTMMTNETSVVLPRNDNGQLTCPNGSGMEELLAFTAHYGGQAGENLDELNRFLFEELEVKGFVEEMEELRQEMMKNGIEKLETVDWAELLKSLVDYGRHLSPVKEKAALASSSHGGSQEPTAHVATTESPCTLSGARCMLDQMNEMVLEEGMEMPYFSCGDLADSSAPCPPSPLKKKHSFLSKLFPAAKRDKAASASEPKLPRLQEVARVQLTDGSMASVNVDTVAKLQKCQWV